MGSRSTLHLFILTNILLLVSILVPVGFQVNNCTIRIATWAVSGILFLIAVFLALRWWRESKRECHLEFGHWSGGPEYDTNTKQFSWRYQVPVTNNSDEQSIGVKRVILRIKRGSRIRDIWPTGFRNPYLGPKQSDTLDFVFSSGGWLVDQGSNEDEEEAQILLTDSDNKSHEILQPPHIYSANFEGSQN